jgi:hypothetical protein
VPVTVVQVGVVWVPVPVLQRLMRVLVRVRLPRIDAGRMLVAVVLVVHVAMRVREKFVVVLVLVALGQVQPGIRRPPRRPAGRSAASSIR